MEKKVVHTYQLGGVRIYVTWSLIFYAIFANITNYLRKWKLISARSNQSFNKSKPCDFLRF